MGTLETTTTASAHKALQLCEAGQFRQAEELAASCPAGPLRLLVLGAIASYETPETAKDLLSEAARALTGESRIKAHIWLACCYWFIGEKSEAKATLASVKPNTESTRFTWYLTHSVFELDDIERSLSLLAEIEPMLEQVNPFVRGKFLNHRGSLHRRKGNSDAAFMDFTEALYWFKQAESAAGEAWATNNIARLCADLNDFEQAHQAVDSAIATLTRLNEKKYLAQAYDQKALIAQAERKHIQARESASKAVSLLGDRQEKELLARSLITEAANLLETGECSASMVRLDRAREIGQYLCNDDLLFDIATAQVNAVRRLLEHTERLRIEVALTLTNHNYRHAAKKLGFNSHSGLIKAMARLNIKRKPQRPMSIITKPLK